MRIRAFVLIGAALMPSAALTQTTTEIRKEPYGKPGDAGADLRCPAGYYVTGLTGATGSNIDRIRLLCAKLGANGVALETNEFSDLVGGPGGASVRVTCRLPGTYLTNFSVRMNNDQKQMQIIRGVCGGPALAGQISGFTFGPPADGYLYSINFACPANMAVTGLTVRYGQHINAVGAICDVLIIPPAPPSPPPPPPTPPVGYTMTGKPRDGSPPPPVAPTPPYAGDWILSTTTQGTFALNLLDGDGYDITGTFTNANDPKYNGTLKGKVSVNGRRIDFTYAQPGIGVTGTGFVIPTSGGKGFVGVVKTNGTPQVTVNWGGRRK